LLAQGSLTPPGAPAPAMKSLAQIEPRTPVSSAPFTISASGSYYLTTNLTVNVGDCIRINANNVTLDLNGFTLASTQNPMGGEAIYVGQSATVTNITILNGYISGSLTNGNGSYGGAGFNDGIYAWSPGGYNVRVKNVTITGCRNEGILLGPGPGLSTIESCAINKVGDTGIYAQCVYNSTAQNCGGFAIWAIIANGCFTPSGTNNITYKYNMP
jgi:hypothetical protein